MERRRIGRSEVDVPVIGFGAWVIADDRNWGHVEEDTAVAVVREAVELGAAFIDTAEVYGNGASERLVGRAIKGVRDKVIVATKAWSTNHKRSLMSSALERSLERLGTDYVDLYYLHWPARDIPFDEPMRALEDLKSRGLIRAACVSNFTVRDMAEASKTLPPDANQVPYSLFWRQIEREILPACRDAGVSVVAYSPLAMGLVTGKFRKIEDVPESNRRRTRLFKPESLEIASRALDELSVIAGEHSCTLGALALAWLVRQPGVAAVIPGAKNVEQLRQNVSAADVKLSDETAEKIRRISEPLFQHLGPDPDMWDMGRY